MGCGWCGTRQKCPIAYAYAKEAYRGVVHGVARDGERRRERKDDAHEARPQDTVHVCDPSNDAVAHEERPRHELDLGVVPVVPPAEDRDDVRQVERHRGHREDRVHRNGAREVEQAGQDADDRDEPDRAERRLRPGAVVPEEAAVGQALVPAEGVDGARGRLKCGLAHEEGGQADEGPDEERSGLAHAQDHDVEEGGARRTREVLTWGAMSNREAWCEGNVRTEVRSRGRARCSVSNPRDLYR